MIKNQKRSPAKSIILIIFSTGIGVYSIVSLISMFKTVNHHNQNELFSTIEYYHQQLLQTGKNIDWTDGNSVRNGLREIQRLKKAEAPYLDTMLTVILDSALVATNAPGDGSTMSDWKVVYCDNLRLQKRSGFLLDSLLALDSAQVILMRPQFSHAEFNSFFARLVSNDSAVTATHHVEDSLRSILGDIHL